MLEEVSKINRKFMENKTEYERQRSSVNRLSQPKKRGLHGQVPSPPAAQAYEGRHFLRGGDPQSGQFLVGKGKPTTTD